MNINHIMSRKKKKLQKLFQYAFHKKRLHEQLSVAKVSCKLKKICRTNSCNPGKRINLSTSSVLMYSLVVMHSKQLDDFVRDTYTSIYKLDPATLGDWKDDKGDEGDSDVEKMDTASSDDDSSLELDSFELHELEAMRETKATSRLNISQRININASKHLNDTIKPTNANILEMSESDMEVDDEENQMDEEEMESDDTSDTEDEDTDEENVGDEKIEDEVKYGSSCKGSKETEDKAAEVVKSVARENEESVGDSEDGKTRVEVEIHTPRLRNTQRSERNTFNEEIVSQSAMQRDSLPEQVVETPEDASAEDGPSFLICLSEANIPEHSYKRIYISKLKQNKKTLWKEIISKKDI